MTGTPSSRRPFSLEAATGLLPSVKLLTAEAVRDADAISAELGRCDESDPRHRLLTDRLTHVVNEWAERIQALELEPKGLWLVDFDNGHGYYCWKYPEDAITHFHGYDDGFAGRMKIV